MEPLITLILPVYNASLTLPRTIESLLAQTLTDWELLIINDGSTDNSSILCNHLKIVAFTYSIKRMRVSLWLDR